eukprot:1987685-Rhodomonas_salina.1
MALLKCLSVQSQRASGYSPRQMLRGTESARYWRMKRSSGHCTRVSRAICGTALAYLVQFAVLSASMAQIYLQRLSLVLPCLEVRSSRV